MYLNSKNNMPGITFYIRYGIIYSAGTKTFWAWCKLYFTVTESVNLFQKGEIGNRKKQKRSFVNFFKLFSRDRLVSKILRGLVQSHTSPRLYHNKNKYVFKHKTRFNWNCILFYCYLGLVQCFSL